MELPSSMDSSEDAFQDDEIWTQVMDKICSGKKTHESHIMGGIHIKFPVKAYYSQELMMSCMIEGVQKSENCLLESPTGTGKTLALLCALLGWQEHCKRRRDWGHTIDEATLKRGCTCGFMQGDPTTYVIEQHAISEYNVVLQKYSYETIVEDITVTDNDQDHSDSKLSPKKKKVEVTRKKLNPDTTKNEYQLCRFCIRSNFKESSVPVIYYATRTISQVEQVVSQLKTTAYSGTKMTILASRSNYCTNLDVTKSYLSVDDQCHKLALNYKRNRKLFEPRFKECDYYHGADKGLNKNIYSNFRNTCDVTGANSAWDIEDLKAYGRRQGGCSFYGSKILREDADIIFCTYNYLLHEGIRKKSKICLINSVLVFDEAHNIEDVCRDIASLHINQNFIDRTVIPSFSEALMEGSKIPQGMPPILDKFLNLFTKFSKWFDCHSEKIDFDLNLKQEQYSIFPQGEIVDELNSLGLGSGDLFSMEIDLNKLEESVTGAKITKNTSGTDTDTGSETQNEISNDTAATPGASVGIGNTNENSTAERRLKFELSVIRYIRNIFEILRAIFGNGQGDTLTEDYRAIFVKSANIPDKFKPKEIVFSNEFKILCLNPAITFKQLKNSSHSIIVTSGTLSPLDSFESELDTPFPIKLSAPHVIQPSQVFSGIAEFDPEDMPLLFNKAGQRMHNNQDALGRAIFKICSIVPYGVLVFLPSYGFMEQLKLRWTRFPEDIPMLQQLKSVKKLYFEDSKRSKEEFNKYMEHFRADIADPSTGGCLLFAVFRGKISEGIDFRDNQARAVLTVGIPYSNPEGDSIFLKQKYNDARRKTNQNILSGKAWYTTQAFRAMNQAFGRCVRHEKDWGSLILLESRMNNNRNLSYLSRWVSHGLKPYREFSQLEKSLRSFVVEKKPEDGENLHEMDTLMVENSEILTNMILPNDFGATTWPQRTAAVSSPQLLGLPENEMDTMLMGESQILTDVVLSNGIHLLGQPQLPTGSNGNMQNTLLQDSRWRIFNNSSGPSQICDIDSENEVLGPSDESDAEEPQYNSLSASQASSVTQRLRKAIYVVSP